MSSSSIPSSDVTTVFTTVRTKATTMPQSTPTPKPSTILDAIHTMNPFRSSAATPRVNTVIGSASLTNSGHTTALRRPFYTMYVFNDSIGLAQPIDAQVRIQSVSDGKSYPRLYPLNRRVGVVENRKRRVGIRTGFLQSGRLTHWYFRQRHHRGSVHTCYTWSRGD